VTLDAFARERLEQLRARGTLRRMRVLDGAQAPRMQVDGHEVLLFAGSNYLDLAHHPELAEASARAARELGCAAGGSRLINGNLRLHEELEEELGKFLGADASLVFATGYMANVGLIPALVGEGDVVVSDQLAHASIIDGCRLSRAAVRVFAHGDLDALEQTLAEVASPRRRVLLALDGVYSMDGDIAPLAEAVSLAQRFGAIVLLDDAHGTGTLGAGGRGTPEHCGVREGVDILVGTLGKALGSFGAFVAGSRLLRELLVNQARSFIFSCALAPAAVAAARSALALVQREPWRREQLQRNARRLRAALEGRGISTAPSQTQIVPVVIGESARTMAVCERLLARGFYTQGIRYPSVPEGTARLRITPMATHTDAEIDALAAAVAEELAAVDG
jgi:8-amino-7-oxononanoate synthase